MKINRGTTHTEELREQRNFVAVKNMTETVAHGAVESWEQIVEVLRVSEINELVLQSAMGIEGAYPIMLNTSSGMRGLR